MTAFLVECPGCHISFPVDSETMRVAPQTMSAVTPFVVTPTERAARLRELHDRLDLCRDLSCRCNQEPA